MKTFKGVNSKVPVHYYEDFASLSLRFKAICFVLSDLG